MTQHFDAFADMLGNIKTPCYVIDTDILTANFKSLKEKSDNDELQSQYF